VARHRWFCVVPLPDRRFGFPIPVFHRIAPIDFYVADAHHYSPARPRKWECLNVADRVHFHERLIFSVGTQVVTLRDVTADGGRMLHPRGSVGVVVRSPNDPEGAYQVRFLDGVEDTLAKGEIVSLARYKEGGIGDTEAVVKHSRLYERVIYRCVIGSRAYGLDHSESDTDRRGIYVPPADLHWSLHSRVDRPQTDRLGKGTAEPGGPRFPPPGIRTTAWRTSAGV
jgi:hypothetical protein